MFIQTKFGKSRHLDLCQWQRNLTIKANFIEHQAYSSKSLEKFNRIDDLADSNQWLFDKTLNSF